MKKRLIPLITLFCSINAYSQTTLDFGIGTGLPYMVESADDDIDITYSNTVAFHVGITNKPTSFYYDLKLDVQYFSCLIKGTNWETFNPINGQVSSITTSLMLEKFTDNEILNAGYAFGAGFTQEQFIADLNFREAEQRMFMSLVLEPKLSYSLNKSTNFLLSARALWFDPVKSFLGSDSWYIGGEDVSLLFQVGMSFEL